MSYQLDHFQPGITLAEVEEAWIRKAFRFYQGNKNQVAQALGISLKTVYNKLEEYGVKDERAGGDSETTLVQGQTTNLSESRPPSIDTQTRARVQPAQKLPEKQAVSMRKR